MSKKRSKASRGAKAVGHGITAIIKIPADGIVKGANMIAPRPLSSKVKEEEKSFVGASKILTEPKTLSQGVLGLGKGIVKGVTGVVTDPYKGAQENGFKGFVQGFGSGVVGVVARPVKGVSDFLESVDHTIDGKNRTPAPDYFSAPLRKQVNLSKQGDIPNIMFECMAQLQMRGLDKEGIFRKSGNHIKIQETKELLKAGKKVNFYDLDIWIIASIFKLWLRELPDPLIPFSYFKKLIALGSSRTKLVKEEVTQWNKKLREIIRTIKAPEIDCLRVLILFLNKFAKMNELNRMTADNLATVIAPNILYRRIDQNALGSMEAVMQTSEEMGYARHIIKVLIEDVEFFFFADDIVETVSEVKSEVKNQESTTEIVWAQKSEPVLSSIDKNKSPSVIITDVNPDRKEELEEENHDNDLKPTATI